MRSVAPRTWLGWVVAGVLFGAGMAWTFRGPLWHGGSLGDSSDGGIAVAIEEHWFRVFAGQAADWRSPGWYWPAPDALGLSDSLFLLGVPYAAARALGASWAVANDVAVAALAAAGYCGFVALARRVGAGVGWGGVFGAAFSFGAVPVFKLGHVQTYTAQLAPVVGLLLVVGWRAWPGWAVVAGLLAGLMFFSAAQTPWFLGLEGGVALLVAAVLARGRLPWAEAGRTGGWFVAGLGVGLVPFVLLYRGSFGLQRDFAAAHFYSGWPRDWIGVPPGEALWSRWVPAMAAGRPVAEVALGMAPVLVATGIALLVGSRRSRAGRACVAAGLLGPLVAIDYGAVEPWEAVFYAVPGGNAVRTPFRIEMAAHFFVWLGVAVLLAELARRSVGHRIGVGALAALLLAEQVGAAPSGREADAMGWLRSAERPPFACTAFYLLPSPGPEPWHEYQSDAMLLSQRLGMPTVNGNSSFYPPGWELTFTAEPDYGGRVLHWLDAHGVREEVCGADPRRHLWVPGVAPLLTTPSPTIRPAPATPLPSG